MKSIDSIKNSKIGRPSVNSKGITLRLHADAIQQIDDWRRVQGDMPNRPEAIRRLIAQALNTADDKSQ